MLVQRNCSATCSEVSTLLCRIVLWPEFRSGMSAHFHTIGRISWRSTLLPALSQPLKSSHQLSLHLCTPRRRNHILVPHMRQVVCPGFATSPVLSTYLRSTRSAVCWDQWGNKGIGGEPSASTAAKNAEIFSIEATH